jgi:hypothetical protein
MKVFWSWQSDTPGNIGRHFVRDALDAAIGRLRDTPDIEEPTDEARAEIHLDQDRKGVSGSPDLARLILEKIAQSAVFIADVTPVGMVGANPNAAAETSILPKKVMNPNVAIELGYALHAIGDRGLLMVMNEGYGTRADLPFDLQAKAGPIMFKLLPGAKKQEIEAASKQLTNKFVEALKLCFAQHVEAARQLIPFPQAEPKDGLGRFRAPGAALGKRWGRSPRDSSQEISLLSGATAWLRLMPVTGPGRDLLTADMEQSAYRKGDLKLLPLSFMNTYLLRAADGIGLCTLETPDSRQTSSVAFAFKTGETWAVDTSLLGDDAQKFVAISIECAFANCLRAHASFLTDCGLKPPFRWIAGLTGIAGRRLIIQSPLGQMPTSLSPDPECMANETLKEGSFDGLQSPHNALRPFFTAMYDLGGIARPDYSN